MPDFKYDVFISYSEADKLKVLRLAERLRNDGIKVWFDDWIIKAGDIISQKLEQGLEESHILLSMMSASSLSSDWHRLEAYAAIFRDPGQTTRRFIPVRLEIVKMTALRAAIANIDWINESDEEYEKILSAIRADLDNLIDYAYYDNNNLQKRLSDLSRKLLTAKTKLELEKLLFEAKNLQHNYPRNWDIQRLIESIRLAIDHTTKPRLYNYLPTRHEQRPSNSGNRKKLILFAALILLLLSALVIWLYKINHHASPYPKYRVIIYRFTNIKSGSDGNVEKLQSSLERNYADSASTFIKVAVSRQEADQYNIDSMINATIKDDTSFQGLFVYGNGFYTAEKKHTDDRYYVMLDRLKIKQVQYHKIGFSFPDSISFNVDCPITTISGFIQGYICLAEGQEHRALNIFDSIRKVNCFDAITNATFTRIVNVTKKIILAKTPHPRTTTLIKVWTLKDIYNNHGKWINWIDLPDSLRLGDYFLAFSKNLGNSLSKDTVSLSLATSYKKYPTHNSKDTLMLERRKDFLGKDSINFTIGPQNENTIYSVLILYGNKPINTLIFENGERISLYKYNEE